MDSAAFVSNIEGISKPWYEIDFFINLVQQVMTFLIMGIVVLGVIRPLINRIMVPTATGKPGEAMVGLDDDVDLEEVEIQEGESLEDIQAQLDSHLQFQLNRSYQKIDQLDLDIHEN